GALLQAPPLLVSQENKVVCRHVRRRLPDGDIPAGALHPARQDGDDRPHDLVLHVEDVLELAVVALAPELISTLGIDKLDGDPQLLAGLADAAFDDVTNTELPSDLLDVDGPPLVFEA